MKIALACQGAFGIKHLEAIQNIPGVDVVSLAGGRPAGTEEVAKKWKIRHWTSDFGEMLKQPGIEAVIIASPTQVHAAQAVQAMRAGKHVLIEIPIADTLADSEEILHVAQQTGIVAMAGHVRRFNPSLQYVHNKITAGELKIQQMDVQTYFFRRTNMNAAGQARTWTDHLLWHHACHTVDLFQWQTGELPSVAYAVEGPHHPELKIAMDMGILLKVPKSGSILTLSLSFNNNAQQGSFFRYIGDNGTYKAYYDDLSDGKDNVIDLTKVDVSMNGIELEDREFFAAIKEKRQPKSSVKDCLEAMRTLDRLEKVMNSQK